MLPSLDHPLALDSSIAEDAPFTLAGLRCTAAGTERFGIREVSIDGRIVLNECRVANAECTSFRITPLGIERRLHLGPVKVVEKTVVAPADAAFAVEWVADTDAELILAIDSSAADLTLQFSTPTEGHRVALKQGQPVQLMISQKPAGTLFDAGAWVRLHNAAADRRAAEWLRVELPDPDLANAFAWAEFRLAAVTADSFDGILALIAVGEFRTARTMIALQQSDRRFLFLLGRLFAASGDDGFARTHWDRARSALGASLNAVSADTLRELAHVAEAIGERAAASEFTRHVHGLSSEKSRWPEFDAGDSDAGVRRWSDLAFLCYQGEKGAWPPLGAQSAANVIIGFVYGLLGFSPDATRGRLRLRPQISDDWQLATIRNVRIGDARVSMECTRESRSWQFQLVQSAGAYPLRLIFEPALPALPKRAFVDGKQAELDYIPRGERIVAPVQIVLDEHRTVTLEL
jgi:hypothetical protein